MEARNNFVSLNYRRAYDYVGCDASYCNNNLACIQAAGSCPAPLPVGTPTQLDAEVKCLASCGRLYPAAAIAPPAANPIYDSRVFDISYYKAMYAGEWLHGFPSFRHCENEKEWKPEF
jgi:hypothetical protein